MSRTTAWTPAEIKELLTADTSRGRKAIERGVVAIYERQTLSEQEIGETVEHNGIGYNGSDATIMSSFALWITRSRRDEGNRLSAKQLAIAVKKIQKYSRQLCEIANEKLVLATVADPRAESLARQPKVACPECHGSGRVEQAELGEWCEVPCPNGCADHLCGVTA